ncbi:hypothetical protein VSS74_28045 [Conexibacter stalactiti]|uniref:Ribbon-helix-helix protein CopG domain-containing protein n=1 Tax=Conexibacter stalactiti TaxID=1940611 RepID=A0ABU4HY41_9ACTN|nr:hypothetical protein [Conexibacter stalactiti]MDW5598242.1 hypothetical protein [Conexibacter stalactiti]MEC5038884.1 hypothetical protein [Conexibacter stalactiti]
MAIAHSKRHSTHVYGLHMLNERLQILVTSEQRRRLEREARQRGVSVGSLIRDAIDAHFGGFTIEERREAVNAIGAMRGVSVTPEEINRIVEEERDKVAEDLLRGWGR